jgi:hypothetical protein
MNLVVIGVFAVVLFYILNAMRMKKHTRGRKGKKRTKRSGGGGDEEESDGPPPIGGMDLIYAIGLILFCIAFIIYLIGWAVTDNVGWTSALGL